MQNLACRVCGCTETNACLVSTGDNRGPCGCWWVAETDSRGPLCSACANPSTRLTGPALTRTRSTPDNLDRPHRSKTPLDAYADMNRRLGAEIQRLTQELAAEREMSAQLLKITERAGDALGDMAARLTELGQRLAVRGEPQGTA